MSLGSSSERFCHNCGAANAAGHNFCSRCGLRISFVGPPILSVAPLPAPYPVTFDVQYPDKLSRLSTGFRFILAIPLIIVVAILGGSASFSAPGLGLGFGLINAMLLFYAITVLMRRRPAKWVFDAVVAIQRFILRAYTYFILMTDRYPPFEGEWPVRYEVEYPERIRRRQLLIWKTIVSIPHFIILTVLSFIVGVFTLFAWFGILFTGQYPKGIHGFVVGWMRWYARVGAYWMSLTDEFPPFSFAADARPSGRTAYALSAVVGGGLTAAVVAGFAVLIAVPPQTEEATVVYEDVLNFEPSVTLEASGMRIRLVGATDPYEFSDGLFQPELGYRFVSFDIEVRNTRGSDYAWVSSDDFRLNDTDGDGHEPFVVSLSGEPPPRRLRDGQLGAVSAIFEIPVFADPSELTYTPAFGGSLAFGERARFVFE